MSSSPPQSQPGSGTLAAVSDQPAVATTAKPTVASPQPVAPPTLASRGITKRVLVPAPADRTWRAATGMDLTVHYEIRSAAKPESNNTGANETPTQGQSQAQQIVYFSTKGKRPRSLRMHASTSLPPLLFVSTLSTSLT